MAARGGKALVLAILISFLVVQGTLGFDFAACYCDLHSACILHTPRSSGKEFHCMKTSLAACTDRRCSKKPPSVMPLTDPVNPVTDEGSMAVPAGGADHGEFNVAEGSVAAPVGVADHGEFIVAEEDAAP
uniref:Jekyll 3 n=1 Tax=Agropyron cristatum TaxID=4593 RepID=A0A4Y5PVZ8_AGRCR|nr:jekyll 3 [Agropyron cristatum]